MLTVQYNAGFFSCCSVKLSEIIKYFNSNFKIPDSVDSSKQFELYKTPKNNADVTYEYFASNNSDIIYSKNIDYHYTYQNMEYKNLNYTDICPFIDRYFSPSVEIKNIIDMFEKKYNINTYDNICCLFYRGNDKITEMSQCTYEVIIEKAKSLFAENSNIRFLIQGDETEFIERMTIEFPNNIIFKDEIRHIKKSIDTVDHVFRNLNPEFSKYYLAITIIMSKCNYIICTSGNCSIWIMLYRGNTHNVYQNLYNKWTA